MQKYFKRSRMILALVFFSALLVAFTDVKGNLPSSFFKSVLYLQFLPSLLKLITPGTILSVGFIIVIAITFLGGRIYCSTICPLGILQDIVIFIRRKIAPKKRYKYTKPLNILRYTIMGFGIISLLFGGILFFNWLDPYSNFGRIATHIYQPVVLKANNIIASSLKWSGLYPFETRPVHIASLIFAGGFFLLIGIMSFIQERLYCNSICPVGALLGLMSKLSFYKIKISKNICTKCGKCQATCKSNCINIKDMSIDESRCVNCFNCIPVCNDGAIGYKMSKVKKSIPENSVSIPDTSRRLLLVATAGYLASKPFSVLASDPEEDHVCFYRRGTVSPPGSLSQEHLMDRCVSCHLCISVCPTKVLQPSLFEYGFTGMLMPKMDYALSFCNFECTKCGEVCPTGAIKHLSVEEKKLTQVGKVQFVKDDCIVETEATACGSCSEHCPTQAVKMVPYNGELTIPKTDTSICIGCGACEYACPVEDPHKAIFVATNKEHLLAEKPVTEKIEYEETDEFPF